MLGGVFLAMTGGEAMYADMGHIGRNPIRTSWYAIVLPALLLNYAGQVALFLGDPAMDGNPFFRLAPSWRRHQPRRPPIAKIRPGSPAPAIGPGTGEIGAGSMPK